MWIVDKPAWTETVTKYRTEQVSKYKCDDKLFNTYDECYEYYIRDDSPAVEGLYPVTVTEQVPYTETINHPEEGHYDYR